VPVDGKVTAMTQRLLHRPARQAPPPVDVTPVQIVSPPALPEGRGGLAGSMQLVLPVLGGGGMVLILVSNSNPLFLLAGIGMLGAMVLGAVLLFVSQRTGAARRFTVQRRRFLDYLEGIREALHGTGVRQRAAAHHRHPDPGGLPDLVTDPQRVWERRPGDPDFGVLRIGLGPDRLWRPVTLAAAPSPLVELDPVTLAAARLLLSRHHTLGKIRVCFDVDWSVLLLGGLL
jgi:S-DNA-T family DNA segregation ATPase FtsK/SpoIIIE